MSFNSFAFAIFLPIVFFIYWALPHKYRWGLLLIASYYFYMSWNAKYVILIFFTTFVSYIAAILIEKEDSDKKKKGIMMVTLLLCLGVLFVFKYFNFVTRSFADFLSIFSIQLNPITLKFLLPVGISFYTFQTLSYVIDVYKGDVAAEHHFGYYATFISFFPQLVAGPIERTRNLLPQIRSKHEFDYDKATYGLKLMAVGFFKKMVIAESLSRYVSKVYDAPEKYSGFSLVLATLFFAIQIYCDFSGYSDIAIGTAKLFGIDLMANFKSPYFSQSIKEFWNRWHISLSTWFRDYVYIPLGGNRVSRVRHSINLMITFLLSGLWHGADWSFVAWGGIHGIFQIIDNFLPNKKNKKNALIRLLKCGVTFSFVAFAWIFFVSNSIGDAWYVIINMVNGIRFPGAYIYRGFYALSFDTIECNYIVVSVVILFIYDYLSLKFDVLKLISSKNALVRWPLYIAFIIWIIMNVPLSNQTTFIYFQF